jgi:hypothetical protein
MSWHGGSKLLIGIVPPGVITAFAQQFATVCMRVPAQMSGQITSFHVRILHEDSC